MSVQRHYDEYHCAYARELNRMLHGHLLVVDDARDRIDGEQRTVCIDRIKNVTVGIDRSGIFVGVTVYDSNGGVWTLYGDGSIEDADHEHAGRHDIKDATLRAAV